MVRTLVLCVCLCVFCFFIYPCVYVSNIKRTYQHFLPNRFFHKSFLVLIQLYSVINLNIKSRSV